LRLEKTARRLANSLVGLAALKSGPSGDPFATIAAGNQ
jgi:hypothetical protein